LYGFPFVRKNIRENFPEILKKFRPIFMNEDLRILCFHQSVEGARVGPFNFTFRYGPDVIGMRDIPTDFDLIFSGHIHRNQILWKQTSNKKIPIIYPGSIERTSFAEKGELKGFYTFTLDPEKKTITRDNLDFIPLPVRDMVILSIPDELDNPDKFEKWLINEISELKENSILKFTNVNFKNKDYLQKKYLSNIIPATMQISINYKFKV